MKKLRFHSKDQIQEWFKSPGREVYLRVKAAFGPTVGSSVSDETKKAPQIVAFDSKTPCKRASPSSKPMTSVMFKTWERF